MIGCPIANQNQEKIRGGVAANNILLKQTMGKESFRVGNNALFSVDVPAHQMTDGVA